jgi:YVTN family beta-propeller protein
MRQGLKKGVVAVWLCQLLFGCFTACNRTDPAFNDTHFPADIDEVMRNKCATAGCHNNESFQNAAGLNLSSYEKLFEGASNGSVVIPYSPEPSSLMQFVNTYSDLGLMNLPSMPLNQANLTRTEVLLLRQWISNGCPNKAGIIPFATQVQSGSKAYITNQGCDVVSVVDAATSLVVRNVKVGHTDGQIEVPHNIKLSSDKKYWYVCFANGNYVQKFDAQTDQLVAEVNVGQGAWNVITLSSDNKKAFVSSLEGNGKLVALDLSRMQITSVYDSPGLFSFPHGMAYSPTNDALYVTAQNGNMLYKLIPATNQLSKISLVKNVAPVETNGGIEPHFILCSPNNSSYYITCQRSNEVRVMQHDTLSAIIPVGSFPLEMCFSPKRNLLFVSCEEDVNADYPSFKGSVYVIDINTNQVVRKIAEPFFQPHGIAVDDKNDVLYVASRNVSPAGPAPHHKSSCNGTNGFYHTIDINTWKVKAKGYEISVDPYSVVVRE